MRENFLPFALPDLDDAEFRLVQEAMASGWITSGPKTRQFEAEFAQAVGARFAVAVNSCTAAMHLALEASGVKRGDEVITTPYTFAASAEVIRYFDARPVLVDVNDGDFNINVELIEAAITEKTRAIIPVHIAGQPAQLDAIYDIAARYNLAVIEDAAHAFPSAFRGRPVGAPLARNGESAVPHFTCYSFYATKTITTGEGGMLTTNDEALAERCRIMSLHGISKDAWKRYTAEGTWYYEIVAPGYKYNMTDVAAAMGIVQLGKAAIMHDKRKAIANRYTAAFSAHPALQVPVENAGDVHAWHLYMLRLNLEHLSIDRAAFIEALKVAKIGASVHFIPLHIHPYYRDLYGYQPADFPVAYREYLREVSLPIYSKMTAADAQDVIDAVLVIADQYAI